MTEALNVTIARILREFHPQDNPNYRARLLGEIMEAVRREEDPAVEAFRAELLRAAEQCETWAREAKSGGWSTHQVRENNELAAELRRVVGNPANVTLHELDAVAFDKARKAFHRTYLDAYGPLRAGIEAYLLALPSVLKDKYLPEEILVQKVRDEIMRSGAILLPEELAVTVESVIRMVVQGNPRHPAMGVTADGTPIHPGNFKPEPMREVCLDCGRLKARNADDAVRGDCPKYWAINDRMAEHDCERVKAENVTRAASSEMEACPKCGTTDPQYVKTCWGPTGQCPMREEAVTLLEGEALDRAVEGFEQQARENFEVSKDIQARDGVDSKGRKRKGKK